VSVNSDSMVVITGEVTMIGRPEEAMRKTRTSCRDEAMTIARARRVSAALRGALPVPGSIAEHGLALGHRPCQDVVSASLPRRGARGANRGSVGGTDGETLSLLDAATGCVIATLRHSRRGRVGGARRVAGGRGAGISHNQHASTAPEEE
jgi:hypothetical protein